MLIRTHRDFRLLWLAQFVSQMGDKIYAIALSWWVLELTVSPKFPEGDPSRVGYIMAAGALGATLFGPWLGTLADKFPRRYLMMTADLARCVLASFLAYLAFTHQGNMTALYIVVFLLSLFTLLFNPATHAILGSLVTDEEMHEALSFQQITQNVCNVLGAGVGGALVAAVGVKMGLAADASTFALSALFISFIARRERADEPPKEGEAEAHAAGARGGLVFLKGHPTILGMLLIFCVANIFLAPLFVLIPSVTKIVLKGTAATLGMMEGALALGSILTTLAVLKAKFQKRWPFLAGAVVLNGVCLAVMGISETMPTMVACLAITGGCLAMVNVNFICMLQLLTPDNLKGRVFSLMETIATGAFPMAFFLAGVATNHLSIPTIFHICGAGLTMAGLLVPLVPGIRKI